MLYSLLYDLLRLLNEIPIIRGRGEAAYPPGGQWQTPIRTAGYERPGANASTACTFGRWHLEKVLAEFIDRYNHARPHHGIEQHRPIEPANAVWLLTGPIQRRDRVGGLLPRVPPRGLTR